MEKVEILMSTQNIQNEKEFLDKIEEANINTSLIIVNQTLSENIKENKIIKNDKRLYNYKEKGASNSRNRLLEKASGDINIFADDDIKYIDNYEELIKKAYKKYPDAEGILFYVENTNKKREKNKRLKNKKINFLDVMRLRIYELSLKKETIQKIKEKNIKFDIKFGPGAKILKGEDTIFLSDLVKNKIKLYSVEDKIGSVGAKESSWFRGFNDKFLFDQGAIFKRIAPKIYWMLIIQYVIRKYNLYRENVSMLKAIKVMFEGAKNINCK